MAKAARGEKWHERRNEIVDTAARMFAQQGYDRTGLTELCEAVGLGRGALYYYIESKENVVSLIHERVIDEVLACGRRIIATNESPVEQIRALGRDLIRIVTQNPDHVWVTLHEFRALTGTRAKAFRNRRRDFEDLVADILQRGVDDGVFAIDHVRLTALGWLGLHNYVYIWYRSAGHYTPDQVSEAFSSMVLDGILKTS